MLISPLAVASLPASPAAELNDVGRDETEIMGRYASQLKRNQEQQIADVKWADELESDVLKPWQQLRLKVDRLGKSRLVNREWIQGVADCFAMRERSWNKLILGLRRRKQSQGRRISADLGPGRSDGQKTLPSIRDRFCRL